MSARVGANETASFPPFVGSAPTSGAVDLDPETCARAEAVFCDTVAINVVSPGKLSIEVGWLDLDAGNDDIDIILFDSGRSGTYTRIDGSETSSRPEQMNTKVPSGLVNLVVVHFAGANDGYSVTTTVIPTATASASGAAAPSGSAVGSTTNATVAPRGNPAAGGIVPRPPRASGTANAISTPSAARGSAVARGSTAFEGTPTSSARAGSVQAIATRGDPGGDIGWIAWIVAGLCPLILGAVLLAARRANAALPV